MKKKVTISLVGQAYVTHTYGGKVDHRAIIGHAPEDRSWVPGNPVHAPDIDPTARIEALASVDAGKERPTYVGPRSWLMKQTHVGHDARIGADCELAPHSTICGHAELGDAVKIGVNACVLPFVKVGTGARIGAGAVVTKNVPPGEVWVGNPAHRLRLREQETDRDIVMETVA